MASVSSDGIARLWDVATQRTLATFKGHQDWVIGVAFSPDGKLLATASFDRTVRLWEIASGREQAVLRGHRERVVAVVFSPDGRTLAGGTYPMWKGSGPARLWRAPSFAEIALAGGSRPP